MSGAERCPMCGSPVSDGSCQACNWSAVPLSLTLRSAATGKTLTLKVPMDIGRGNLRLDDPDERFLAPRQMRIERSLERKGWVLTALPEATNLTWVAGAPVPTAGHVLRAGDEISIKGVKLRLNVELA